MFNKHLAHTHLQFGYLRQRVHHFVGNEVEASFTFAQLYGLLKYLHVSIIQY